MDSEGDKIRQLATPDWAMEVLLRGSPSQIYEAGLVGADADSALTAPQLAELEALGFKTPGRPMTVTQMAQAVMAGVLSPDTQIVKERPNGF
jgi:hypothetical protein